jgi:hypothetical protein
MLRDTSLIRADGEQRRSPPSIVWLLEPVAAAIGYLFILESASLSNSELIVQTDLQHLHGARNRDRISVQDSWCSGCGGGLLLPVPAAARPAGFDRAIDCRGGLIVDEPARSLPAADCQTIPRLKMAFSRGKSAFATAK